MFAIRITSPAFSVDDDVHAECGFMFPMPPEFPENWDDFVYHIFMLDSQFGNQTDCPRSLWQWEAISVLGQSDIRVVKDDD